MRSILPSALRFARCFSIAFALIPILSARATALSLPSCESRVIIFSLLFVIFSLLFFKILSFSPYGSLLVMSTAWETSPCLRFALGGYIGPHLVMLSEVETSLSSRASCVHSIAVRTAQCLSCRPHGRHLFIRGFHIVPLS